MKKYSYELKLKIVKEKEEGYGDRYLAKKYKVSRTSVKAWCNQYRYLGEEGLKEYKENPTYTEEFKHYVLKYRQENNLSYRQTAQIFKIKHTSTIRKWQDKINRLGYTGLNETITEEKNPGEEIMSKKKNKLTQEEIEKLKEENEYLRAENLYLKKLKALIQKKNQKTEKKQ